jgi:tetratricopeptide (TPR) repeat protein
MPEPDPPSLSNVETKVESGRGHASGDALAPGAMLGRYVIESQLGEGGAGLVYAAFDPELGRRVAIKLLRLDEGDAQLASQGRARLYREAQAMARLTHPNVMPIYDVGVHRERVFLAMELVEGGTLRAWLKQPRPRRQILDAFLAAGAGLAAAHAAGLVHRDFKPDNVLVGSDGRVRVTDFGLVRTFESGLAQDTSSSGATRAREAALEVPLTRVDTVMGTPPYMAPEQHRAQPTDARTDQFSFCVSLHEGLYGVRPFDGKTVEALADQACHRRVVEPPPGSNVPAWLRQIILRGLSVDPAERFPSIDALLVALRNDPALRRRRIAAALGVVMVGALALGGGRAWLRHQSRLCGGAAARLSGVWDPTVAAGVQRAFAATGIPSAELVARGVVATLDAYAREWTAMHTDACEATRLRGEQPESVMALRMSCLNERLHELRALGNLFTSADAGVALRAVEAAGALSPVRHCGDVAMLTAPLPPPRDQAVAARADALRVRMAEAKALLHAGRYVQGLSVANTIVDEARPLHDLPLEAEAKLLRGQLLAEDGKHRESEATLAEAFTVAYSARHDAVAAEAAIWETWVDSYWLARNADGHRWAGFAEAAIRRLGGDEALEAQMLWRDALAFVQEGDGEQALARARRALQLGERAFGARSVMAALLHRALGTAQGVLSHYDQEVAENQIALQILTDVLGPGHPEVGATLQNLGATCDEMGRPDEAIEYDRKALAVLERALGAEHPRIAITLSNLGDPLRRQKRFAEALPLYQRALAMNDKHFSPTYPDSAWPLRGLGYTYLGLGRPREAIAPLERAVAVARAGQLEPGILYNAQMGLADALWLARSGAGQDRARARKLVAEVRAAVAGQDPTLLAIADKWLAAHRAR